MTSLERVLTTLSHKEPDRVPFFLLLTLQGSRECGVPIIEYFSRPEMVARAQIRMQEMYGHDCLYNLYYLSLEIEAWGGNSTFYPEAPPTSGKPLISSFEEIASLEAPDVWESMQLGKVLKTTELLKQHSGNRIPIIGVAISPFSLPTIQMGLGNYIELLYEEPSMFKELMKFNEEFSVQWANAQIEAGAHAICYFDPVSSTTLIPPELYRKTGFEVARRSISRIKGPVVTHMASGRCLKIINDIADTGTVGVCTSVLEDLLEVKSACKGRMTVIGNLNGIEMRNWSRDDAECEVRAAIEKAAKGGGYILADNHGEIPLSVPQEVLAAVSLSAKKWGQYL